MNWIKAVSPDMFSVIFTKYKFSYYILNEYIICKQMDKLERKGVVFLRYENNEKKIQKSSHNDASSFLYNRILYVSLSFAMSLDSLWIVGTLNTS